MRKLLYRTGYTEGSTIVSTLMNRVIDLESDYPEKPADIEHTKYEQRRWSGWLYTIAGLYDKKLTETPVDYREYIRTDDHSIYTDILNTESYRQWLDLYIDACNNSTYTQLITHYQVSKLFAKKNDWNRLKPHLSDGVMVKGKPTAPDVEEIMIRTGKDKTWQNFHSNSNYIYNLIRNKRVLLVNSYASLLAQQYTSGNVHIANPEFPELLDIKYLDTPCCFFGVGPDSNSIETIYRIADEILCIKDIDVILISFGGMALPVANICEYQTPANILCIGNMLQQMFCVDTLNDRGPGWLKKIPEEYITENIKYKLVENGRYFG